MMERSSAFAAILCAFLLGSSVVARAQAQIFTDRAAFEAALAAQGLISDEEGFEDPGLAPPVNGSGLEIDVQFGIPFHDYGAFTVATSSNYGLFRLSDHATAGANVFGWDAGHSLGFMSIVLQPVTLTFDEPLLAWGADVIGFGSSPISDFFDPPPLATMYELQFTGADLVDHVVDTARWSVNDATQCPTATAGCVEAFDNVQFFGVISDVAFSEVTFLNTGIRNDSLFFDTFNDATHLDRMVTAEPCSSLSDFDGDGVVDPTPGCPDPVDNCPHVANPGQEDANFDGTGDACTCGDLTGDGLLTDGPGSDVDRYQEIALQIGAPVSPEEDSRCHVDPEIPGCNLIQAVIVQRDVNVQGPGIAAACSAATPLLAHRWTFNARTNDSISNSHGTLLGGASISAGKLVLDGENDYLRTTPILRSIGEKTLVSWVGLDNLTQRSGGVLTLQDPTGTDVFDSIVFGEQLPAQWMNGSDFLARTPSGDNGGPLETQTSPTQVMMAIAYEADGDIVIYRDGAEYSTIAASGPVTYPAGIADVVIGLRHEDASAQTGTAGGLDAYLAGTIDEAQIYAAALSAAQLTALAAQGPTPFDPSEVAPLALWYDAADASTLDLDGGQAVLEWRDKGPDANHLTAVAGQRPVKLAGATGMLEFDGVDDHLCGTGGVDLQSSGFSIFVVARNDVRKNYQGIFSLRTSQVLNADLEVYWQGGTSNSGSGNLVYASNRRLQPAGFFLNVNSPPAFGNDYVASIHVPSESTPGQLRINGGALGNSNTSGGNYFPDALLPPCVGYGVGTSLPGNTLDGRIGELIVFSSVVSGAARDSVEQYLIEKWGITP